MDLDPEESISGSDLSDEDISWISWFCSLSGNEIFCEIDEEYIQDDFNLTGLSQIVPYYDFALDTILEQDSGIDAIPPHQQEMVESAAEILYGLIHSRFILTNRGLMLMGQKYLRKEFGKCLRVNCENQALLPIGLSDVPQKSDFHMVKFFCPRCDDVYNPTSRKHSHIDGSFFGTTFPHLLLQMYPDFVPDPPVKKFIPTIFGYRIHPTAPNRMKIKSVEENIKDDNDYNGKSVPISSATNRLQWK